MRNLHSIHTQSDEIAEKLWAMHRWLGVQVRYYNDQFEFYQGGRWNNPHWSKTDWDYVIKRWRNNGSPHEL